MAITAPRGTQDILPGESYRWQFVERLVLEAASKYGFQEIRTPTFEQLDLFCRSVGDTTDVVQKEMFEVKAQKGTDLFALKPEGTAGVVRSAIEKSLLNDALPFKACYITPCFRHERPQAGRLREFHQFGCEMFGSKSPSADVEIISIANHIFQMLDIKGIELNINSIGCPTCRADYHRALKEYFTAKKDVLCGTCLERLDKNPMRILDCKCPTCQEVAKDAPIVLDYLCEDCKTHFDGVQTRLHTLGIPFQINTKIVRGLDYYTKTVFEFISNDIGAQGTICGGGRYDGLVEQLGGKPTPALGFGMGIERLLMLLQAQGITIPEPRACELYIGSMGEKANIKACELTNQLRAEGFYVECDLMDRSVKAQMKYANKIKAQYSFVLGDNELETGKANLKDMQTSEQKEIDFNNDLMNILYDAMLAREANLITEQIGEDAFSRILGMDK
ncbi:histidine--tRNA ligase [Paludicola sp. MB14-C6]|uniref:histidine--tRNA ligase n=1 Tax=Paludihabitans sp. MB14-C6 TaxID=3070656 RepID=UPI0027DE54B0|nr:histidine--tRNA ligase [Paludicola sp. MB14-C6]WMJ21859.1 histidine--tRNA ligase [Paludicola sp. MB14-C6]